MNFYLKKNNNRWKFFLVYFLVIIFLVIVLNVFALPVKNLFFQISSPVTKYMLASGYNSSSFFENIFYRGNLKKENNALKRENEILLAQVVFLKNYKEQKKDFESAVNNEEYKNLEMVPVGIIGIDSKNGFLLIDKGEEDGILKNMPVVSSQKVLFGRTVDVYKNFSRVMLISNKNSAVSAKIDYIDKDFISNDKNNEAKELSESKNEDEEMDDESETDRLKNESLNFKEDAVAYNSKNYVYGVVKGLGGMFLHLDLVPLEDEIEEGGILITSAMGGIFPKNFLIGRIISVEKNDLKPFQTAQIKPFFDISKSINLMVITNYLQEE